MCVVALPVQLLFSILFVVFSIGLGIDGCGNNMPHSVRLVFGASTPEQECPFHCSVVLS